MILCIVHRDSKYHASGFTGTASVQDQGRGTRTYGQTFAINGGMTRVHEGS